jgi:hypothetical protein
VTVFFKPLLENFVMSPRTALLSFVIGGAPCGGGGGGAGAEGGGGGGGAT